MKKLLIAIAFIFGVTLATKAQTKPAEFKFEQETHDFGKVVLGKPVSFDYKFTNIGDQPLIITKVEPTCGCTVPKFTNVPIKKGETGTISITYNPAGAAMPFNKAITVSSNAKTPVKVLYFKGENVEAKKD